MESYLSRVLKNWAASSQPSPHGRERLLHVAAQKPLHVRRKSGFDTLRGVFLSSNYRGFHEEMLSRSLSQSTLWSFQIVASQRLLA
jgi:hypothetical protein